MSENQRLITSGYCAGLFRELGLEPGDDVMVHASLKGFGYIVNGADDIVDALLQVVGPGGTVLAPAHSGQLTDPADWSNPPVPSEWWDTIKAEMKPFDRLRTPVRMRGNVADALLRMPGVMRSHHPIASVSALGARASYYTEGHRLHESEGEGSPCFKLAERGGKVLLLGVGLESCTALHAAEFIADAPYLNETRVRVLCPEAGTPDRFVRLERYPTTSRHFVKLEPELREKGFLAEKELDGYRLSLVSINRAVEVAVSRLRANPYCLITP